MADTVKHTPGRIMDRPTFPILNGNGAMIDYQLVADHGEQAQKNHYQSVKRLTQRGGLSWSELHAVLHGRSFQKIDQNTAIIECRALEARYLASLSQERAYSVEEVGDPEAWLLHDPALLRPQMVDPRWMSIDQIREQIAILEEELRARAAADRAEGRS